MKATPLTISIACSAVAALQIGTTALAAPRKAGPASAKKPAALSPSVLSPNTASNVIVSNTTAQPVPTVAQGTTAVSGSVSAAQQGAWSVGITGTPSVTIANAPSVRVANAPTAPVPVALVNEGSRVPFQQQSHITTDQSGMGSAVIAVPAGWRLVIEHINGFAYVGSQDDLMDYQIGVTYKGAGMSYEFRPVPLNATDRYHSFVNEALLAYADPGSLVGVSLETSTSGPGAPTASGYVTISGYLER
jgi:hypothetical protein